MCRGFSLFLVIFAFGTAVSFGPTLGRKNGCLVSWAVSLYLLFSAHNIYEIHIEKSLETEHCHSSQDGESM